MLFLTNFRTQEIFCNKKITFQNSLYGDLTQCAKHLKTNFKHLLGMELAADLIFLVLLSVNNDLSIYVFAAGVGGKIKYVGTTELKKITYISARTTCTITFSVKET